MAEHTCHRHMWEKQQLSLGLCQGGLVCVLWELPWPCGPGSQVLLLCLADTRPPSVTGAPCSLCWTSSDPKYRRTTQESYRRMSWDLCLWRTGDGAGGPEEVVAAIWS